MPIFKILQKRYKKNFISKCTLCIKGFINTYTEAHFQKDDIHFFTLWLN